MVREFLRSVLFGDDVKDEYFRCDHHYYVSRDSEWDTLLSVMDRDFFIEWILPVIYEKDRDLYEVADQFMLYMVCKGIIEERLNKNESKNN